MNKIYVVDLSNKSVEAIDYDVKAYKHYGRGLAVDLMEKYVAPQVDRYDSENAVVMAPGLFTGTYIPTTGRLVVATKKHKEKGAQINNMSGSIAQRIASLNIAAVVIKGNYEEGLCSLVISNNGIEIISSEDLKGAEVSRNIEVMRKIYGKDASIIGIGPSGEALLPLSTLFSTYPEGDPVYYCSRGGVGDVFGVKGIKSIVVAEESYFKAEVFDQESLEISAKKLGKLMVSDPVCGTALPGYGSITLMKMLKAGRNIKIEKIKKKANTTILENKINRTCSPICVIGCLNRHCKDENSIFSSPAESEAYAALKQCFDIDDMKFTSEFNNKAFELGLDSTELIFACALYLKAENIKGTKEVLNGLLEEIKNLSIVGRVVGSRTEGIYSLYKEKKELKPMVSRPSTREEGNFNVKLINKDKFPEISDLELLYGEIITLENLGFCLFSSFALIDNKEALDIITELYYAKTGERCTGEEIIKYSLSCLEKELNYEAKAKGVSIEKTIPEFVKVLYSYFDNKINE